MGGSNAEMAKPHDINSFLSSQDVKLNGNKLGRVPTEALRGPESLQNLQLQDNFIGKLFSMHDDIIAQCASGQIYSHYYYYFLFLQLSK